MKYKIDGIANGSGLPIASTIGQDFIASIVVFLVALPLCMGIAIASGAPAAVGILTGVVGGLIVGALSGSPLQVSGPAAGLVVLVVELSQQHGYETLGLIIMIAGGLQITAGLFGLGRWFRAVPPSVIHGMLSGIGLLLVASQFQIMFDKTPKAAGWQNLLAIPNTVLQAFSPGNGNQLFAAGLGVITIAGVLLWDRFAPRKLKIVPGALIGVFGATLVSVVLSFPVKHVEIPAALFDSFHFPSLVGLSHFKAFELLVDALVLAFIASTETMLTASAIDKLSTVSRTDYDKELRGQGIGNMVSGFLGLLPITGVIARSGVNVRAGAQTRASSVMHGIWLIGFVCLLPGLLKMVPVAALAALLVVTGYKLFLSKESRELHKFGKSEVGIYAVTLGSIVIFDLLTGVIVGVVLSVAKLLYVFAHLRVETEAQSDGFFVLHLSGAATFLSLPKLATALEKVPPGSELHIELRDLEYIDHACLDLLGSFEKQHTATGGVLKIDWESLSARFFARGKNSQAAATR